MLLAIKSVRGQKRGVFYAIFSGFYIVVRCSFECVKNNLVVDHSSNLGVFHLEHAAVVDWIWSYSTT